MSASELFPLMLVDPDCSDWSGPVSEDVIEVADALRDRFTVLMGELDLQAVHERSSDGMRPAFMLLREALILGCVWVRGLGLDEPSGVVLGSVDSEPRPALALVRSNESDLHEALKSTDCASFTSMADFLASRRYREVLVSGTRTYDTMPDRSRSWRELFEPFSRTRYLNIYETYLFKELTYEKLDLSATGLHWLLQRFDDRASRSRRNQTIHIRGTFRDQFPRSTSRDEAEVLKDQLALITKRCRALVKEFGTRNKVVLEVCDRGSSGAPGSSPHDRFWIGRDGNNATRVMVNTNSVIQFSGRNRPKGGSAVSITITSNQRSLRAYSAEWSKTTPFVVRSFPRD